MGMSHVTKLSYTPPAETGIGVLPGQVTESGMRTGQQISDADLVGKARSGDVGAFGELVKRYQKAVYAVVSRMVSSRDDADDLAQEIFLAAWKGLAAFRGDAQFGTWLHTIAVNATLKRIKWLKRREAASIDDPDNHLEDRLPDSSEETPLDRLMSGEEREAVRRAVRSLSEKHQIVVLLYYFEQMPCEEIARVMECSVGTVWSRLHYACKKLKGELAGLKDGLGEAAPARGKQLL